jgi:hypothetical protein
MEQVRGVLFLIDENHILFLKILLNVGMDMNEERKHFYYIVKLVFRGHPWNQEKVAL